MTADYQLCKNIRENKMLRESFFDLAEAVYGLSFRDWYSGGFWTARYQPYVITDGVKVMANASVNRIETVLDGEEKHLIQIGTVMTDPVYRNRGLSRWLMEEIIADWKEKCDGIYLYANDSVLDFYPRFGFIKAYEYQHTLDVGPTINAAWEKVDMSLQSSIDLLRTCYRMGSPHAKLTVIDNFELLMFYCGSYRKDDVYYSPKLNVICIAAQEGKKVQLLDTFGGKGSSLEELAGMLPFEDYDSVVLGFTPKEQEHCGCERLEEDDDTLFVYREKENLFSSSKIRLPQLSHA